MHVAKPLSTTSPIANIIEMSIWSKYAALPAKTRLIAGVGIMSYAGAALYLSDKAEEKFGLVATDEDKENLRKSLPRITTVDRENSSIGR